MYFLAAMGGFSDISVHASWQHLTCMAPFRDSSHSSTFNVTVFIMDQYLLHLLDWLLSFLNSAYFDARNSISSDRKAYRAYKITLLVWHCIVGVAPEYLMELWHPVNSSSGRKILWSVSRGDLIVPRYWLERSGHWVFAVSEEHNSGWNSTVIRHFNTF